MHLLATFPGAFGTTVSAFRVLALNSWLQMPAGHRIEHGEFCAVWSFEIAFNPSFPYRLTHMLLASALTAAFLMAGLAAWQLLKPG